METRRVTIAVINHNYERFLSAAIDSALAQTHPDVEVVVVDDGSSDGSRRVIDTYGDRVVAVLKENGGQASAINAAVEAGTGAAFMFLDADDLLEPGAAATVAQALDHDVAWVMFRLRIIDEQGADTGRVRPHRRGVMPDGDLRDHLARYRCFHWQPTSGNAFATAALEQVMPIPEEEFRLSADAYLAGVVPLCGRVRASDVVGGSYRLHRSSNFTSVAVDERYFRSQIERQVASHRHAVRVAGAVGVDLPADVRAPRDAAFLGFRLASLLLDPANHPFPDDRRAALVAEGLRASITNPQLSWPNRVRRSLWFLACGVLPRSRAAHLAATSAPDTPARRALRVKPADS